MFRSLPKSFDWLLAYSNTKQSVKMSESKRQARRDDPMDVDALSKGKMKGQGKKGSVGSGNGNKGQNFMSNVGCWNCGKFCHHGRGDVVRSQRRRKEQRRQRKGWQRQRQESRVEAS